MRARVWLGGSRCCRERYLVLAAAFWEMTYFGFEYERVCARRAEEKARRLVGKDVPGERPSEPPAHRVRRAAAGRRRGSGSWNPTGFELDYRDSMIVRVAQLNDDSRKAFGCCCSTWRAVWARPERQGLVEAIVGEEDNGARTGTGAAGACSRTKLMPSTC